jgi:hypothetical protein
MGFQINNIQPQSVNAISDVISEITIGIFGMFVLALMGLYVVIAIVNGNHKRIPHGNKSILSFMNASWGLYKMGNSNNISVCQILILLVLMKIAHPIADLGLQFTNTVVITNNSTNGISIKSENQPRDLISEFALNFFVGNRTECEITNECATDLTSGEDRAQKTCGSTYACANALLSGTQFTSSMLEYIRSLTFRFNNALDQETNPKLHECFEKHGFKPEDLNPGIDRERRLEVSTMCRNIVLYGKQQWPSDESFNMNPDGKVSAIEIFNKQLLDLYHQEQNPNKLDYHRGVAIKGRAETNVAQFAKIDGNITMIESILPGMQVMKYQSIKIFDQEFSAHESVLTKLGQPNGTHISAVVITPINESIRDGKSNIGQGTLLQTITEKAYKSYKTCHSYIMHITKCKYSTDGQLDECDTNLDVQSTLNILYECSATGDLTHMHTTQIAKHISIMTDKLPNPTMPIDWQVLQGLYFARMWHGRFGTIDRVEEKLTTVIGNLWLGIMVSLLSIGVGGLAIVTVMERMIRKRTCFHGTIPTDSVQWEALISKENTIHENCNKPITWEDRKHMLGIKNCEDGKHQHYGVTGILATRNTGCHLGSSYGPDYSFNTRIRSGSEIAMTSRRGNTPQLTMEEIDRIKRSNDKSVRTEEDNQLVWAKNTHLRYVTQACQVITRLLEDSCPSGMNLRDCLIASEVCALDKEKIVSMKVVPNYERSETSEKTHQLKDDRGNIQIHSHKMGVNEFIRLVRCYQVILPSVLKLNYTHIGGLVIDNIDYTHPDLLSYTYGELANIFALETMALSLQLHDHENKGILGNIREAYYNTIHEITESKDDKNFGAIDMKERLEENKQKHHTEEALFTMWMMVLRICFSPEIFQNDYREDKEKKKTLKRHGGAFPLSVILNWEEQLEELQYATQHAEMKREKMVLSSHNVFTGDKRFMLAMCILEQDNAKLKLSAERTVDTEQLTSWIFDQPIQIMSESREMPELFMGMEILNRLNTINDTIELYKIRSFIKYRCKEQILPNRQEMSVMEDIVTMPGPGNRSSKEQEGDADTPTLESEEEPSAMEMEAARIRKENRLQRLIRQHGYSAQGTDADGANDAESQLPIDAYDDIIESNQIRRDNNQASNLRMQNEVSSIENMDIPVNVSQITNLTFSC